MKHSSPTVCGKCGTTFTEYDHDQPGLCLDCWELWDTECWAKSPLGKLEGENAALRAANEELGSKLATLQMWVADCPNCATLRGKLRELDAWMTENHYEQRTWWGMTDATRAKLRELGLLEVNDESSHE